MHKRYKINTDAILSSDAWGDATEGELRVLVYLVAKGGMGSQDAVAKALGISRARAKAAIGLWRDVGVLEELSDAKPAVTDAPVLPKIEYEFTPEARRENVDEEASGVVAEQIRDGALAELIADIAELMERPSLSTQEIKHITATYSQLSLGKEYIQTLAQYLASLGKLAPKRLSDEAARLVERGIDNLELLEKYIEDATRHSGEEWELRKLLGIWGRNLSKTEEKYFKLWMIEYGYAIDVIGEAYDITVMNTGKVALRYMNTLLTAWHKSGLKTVDEIVASRETERELVVKKKTAEQPTQKKKTKTADSPLYADFSSDDALMRALMRSYGDGGEDGGAGEV